jgi:hypothetical protein
MYFYRLWVHLAESTEESDCGQLDAKCVELQQIIVTKLICKPSDPICHVNYSRILQLSGGANHKGSDHESLLDVLRHLVYILPGSHGLVYWSDDEDPVIADCYKVIVIARGAFYERFDPFLSPKRPTIED